MSENEITTAFIKHYTDKIREHGPNAEGVCWRFQDKADMRHDIMLTALRPTASNEPVSILDVGCGYGAVLDRIAHHGLSVDYTGIDIVPEMIEHGKRLHPESTFIHGDFLKSTLNKQYDYVFCNGIMTLKLTASIMEMDKYTQQLIKHMFSHCNVGIAFNLMTSAVNFHDEALFYKSPVETLAFCLTQLSTKVRLDQSYPLYEYMTFVYKD